MVGFPEFGTAGNGASRNEHRESSGAAEIRAALGESRRLFARLDCSVPS